MWSSNFWKKAIMFEPRGVKVDILKSSYSSYGDRFEVARIADIAHDQFLEALVGIDAVVHLASPLAGRAEPAALLAMFQSAVEGTLNVLMQAENAGIKRMVTSSIATVQNPHDSFTDKDWNPVTREIALTSTNEMATYAASKKFSEIALWEWADRHPHVDVTTRPRPRIGLAPHGRGRAKTHHRRVPVRMAVPEDSGLHRPALRSRLITATPEVKSLDVLPPDFGRIEQVVGMNITDFHTTEQTTLDTIDAIVKVEDQWRSAGHAIKIPPFLSDSCLYKLELN
ncbi:hypothetical protein C8R44DRAFT_733307 [Mycena epipterygia]|nr:hypothetical protein C8R44DRAFT_733307 [Mycena epipterygia]